MAVWITARLDDAGTLTARVSASEPYGKRGRTATNSVDIDAGKLPGLYEALADVLAAYGPEAERQARIGAARALVVAADAGEE